MDHGPKRYGKQTNSSSSIPQYLSAVRQMNFACLGNQVPSFPLVSQALRAYRKWEEESYPQRTVRCGLGADIVQRIWTLGMGMQCSSVLMDAACCVFAFCLNGLRDSSVTSLESKNVIVNESELSARLSVVKGREASQEQLVSFRRWSDQPSPVDLRHRWKLARRNHPIFFALAGESVQANRDGLNASLMRCLEVLGVTAPPGGHFSSHSLRIGAHTEQVLLHIPREARMARFGWGPNSEELTSLHSDPTIRTTAASFWFFGSCCSFSPPAATGPSPPSGKPASTA